MKTTTIEQRRISFRGILRTSRGSVILVAIENMPIAPTGALTVVTGAAYGHPAEPQEGDMPTTIKAIASSLPRMER